nr:MAG TPA: hypothetical protein [Caudoviricetes sp.]
MKKISHAITLYGTWYKAYIPLACFNGCNKLVKEEIKNTLRNKTIQDYVRSLYKIARLNRGYANIYSLTYQIACKVCRNNKIKELLPGLYADYQQISKAITAPAQIEQAIKQTVKDLNFNYLKQYHDKKTHTIKLWTTQTVKSHIGYLLTYNPNKSLSFFADLLHTGLDEPLTLDGLTVWNVASSCTSLLDLKNKLSQIYTLKTTKHKYSKDKHTLVDGSIYQMTVNGLRRVFIIGNGDTVTEANDTYICERQQTGLQYMYNLTSNYIYSQRSADTISLQAPTAQDLTLADTLQDKSDARALQEFKAYVNIINDFYSAYKSSSKVVLKTFDIYCKYLILKCIGLPDYKIYNKINITNKPLQRYKAMYSTMFYDFVKNK